MECRLAYARAWAERIMLEKKEHEYSYFLTLTYEPGKENMVPILDKNTGEIVQHTNLSKKDLQDFMKEYRRNVKTKKRGGIPHDYGKCRFFRCGEYGEHSERRHLHIIMFQEKPIDDRKFYKLTRDKLPLYTSQKVNDIWGRGYVIIGDVTLESAGYVRRYVTKKLNGKNAEIYDQLGIEKEFVQMSRKPGIGMNYFKEHKDEIYKYDHIIIPSGKGDRKILKPAKAFDEKFWEEEPVLMQEIKDKRRKIRIAERERKLARTSLYSPAYGKIEADINAARQKTLKRGDV